MSNRTSVKQTRDDYFQMGFYYQQRGDLRAAAECYARSIQNHPSAEAHTNLGWVLSQLGDIPSAIQECEKALQINPKFGHALNDLGSYLLDVQQLERAEKVLKQAVRIRGNTHTEYPHFNLARLYVQKGMLLKACEELKTAVKQNPKFTQAEQILTRLERVIH